MSKHHLPPLRKLSEYSDDEMLVGKDALFKKNPKDITFLKIDHKEDLSKKSGVYVEAINRFKKVEVLILKLTKLGDILKPLELPNLRFLDLSGNNISHVSTITNILTNSPYIEHLVLRDNPKLMKRDGWKFRIIYKGKLLKSIDLVTITEKDRTESVEYIRKQKSKMFVEKMKKKT